jgi:hypothetical protein
MDLSKRLPVVGFILVLVFGCMLQKAGAQYITISGTVYDITARRPLEAVGVISTSGRGAITDSLGKYSDHRTGQRFYLVLADRQDYHEIPG